MQVQLGSGGPGELWGPKGVGEQVGPLEVVPGESETLHGVMGTQFSSRGHCAEQEGKIWDPVGVTADRWWGRKSSCGSSVRREEHRRAV